MLDSAPSNEGGAFPAAIRRPLAGDKSAWRTPCSASEVPLLDTSTQKLGVHPLLAQSSLERTLVK